MLPDGSGSHGGGTERLAGGDEAGGLRPALPAFAGGVVGGRGPLGHAGGGDHGGQSTQRAVLVRDLAAFQDASSAAKALAEKPRLGRHPAVPALDRARLLAEVARDPLALGYAATNWTVPLPAAHLRGRGYPVTARTLRRRLHAAGLRWKRPRFVLAEPAPHVAQKKGRSCGR